MDITWSDAWFSFALFLVFWNNLALLQDCCFISNFPPFCLNGKQYINLFLWNI
jgi:hypothetical protein